eukprot:gnl/MRDRNA2_/MRDRNA2_57245_c0_seq1.p1 gnl/MRDRNA2_/MRDRNA2_57245_c0~~gnl/MRDRNA2_/MRDRNA2_57245_c0_seq1.p1  ORF type:complete len:574 (+),score=119.31 gnl/MRDRNA2_/MRDRNA2_57245_c0_seq1:92-1813(+)
MGGSLALFSSCCANSGCQDAVDVHSMRPGDEEFPQNLLPSAEQHAAMQDEQVNPETVEIATQVHRRLNHAMTLRVQQQDMMKLDELLQGLEGFTELKRKSTRLRTNSRKSLYLNFDKMKQVAQVAEDEPRANAKVSEMRKTLTESADIKKLTTYENIITSSQSIAGRKSRGSVTGSQSITPTDNLMSKSTVSLRKTSEKSSKTVFFAEEKEEFEIMQDDVELFDEDDTAVAEPLVSVKKAIEQATLELANDCPFEAEQCLVDVIHKLAPLAADDVEDAKLALQQLQISDVMKNCREVLADMDMAMELMLAEDGWQHVCAKGAGQVWQKDSSEGFPIWRVQLLIDLPLPAAVALNEEFELMQIMNPLLVSCDRIPQDADGICRSTRHTTGKLPFIATLDNIQEWRSVCNLNTGFSLHIRKDVGKHPSMPPTASGNPKERVHADVHILYQPCGQHLTKTLMIGVNVCRQKPNCSNWVATSLLKLTLGQYVPMLETVAKKHADLIDAKLHERSGFYGTLERLLEVVHERQLLGAKIRASLYNDSKSPQAMGEAGIGEIRQAFKQVHEDETTLEELR